MTREDQQPGDYMVLVTANEATLVAWPSCPDCGLKCARFINAPGCPEPTVLHPSDELGGSG